MTSAGPGGLPVSTVYDNLMGLKCRLGSEYAIKGGNGDGQRKMEIEFGDI